MPDIEMWCEKCGENKGHTHIIGRTCICSGCGDYHFADPKDIHKMNEAMDKRRKASTALLENKTGLITGEDVPAADIVPKQKKQGVKPMAKKLTDEQKAEIYDRHKAGEKNAELAAEFGVKPNAIWYLCQIAKRHELKGGKEKKQKKGAAAPRIQLEDLPPPLPLDEKRFSLKDAIAIEVSGHLSALERRFRAIIQDEIKEMLK